MTDNATAGTPVPGRPGYVVGNCGHPMDEYEWNAGHRVCEPCETQAASLPA